MQNELAKIQRCVVIRGSFEIWVDEDKAEKLQSMLENLKAHFFVRWEGQSFNTADVTGIFTAEAMEERTRRKNGQWQCRANYWHDRFEKCACGTLEQREWNEAVKRAVENCGECQNGFISVEGGMARHSCVAPFYKNNQPNYAYRP